MENKCEDCLFYEPARRYELLPKCLRKMFRTDGPAEIKIYLNAWDERVGGECGEEGKYFQTSQVRLMFD